MVVDPITMAPGAAPLRGAGGDGEVPHLRRAGDQGREAGRDPHQPGPALRDQAGSQGRGRDDQGEAGHRAGGDHPGRGEGDPAPAPDREAAGGGRGVQPEGADHHQGHREADQVSRMPARTSWAACGSGRRSGVGPRRAGAGAGAVKAGVDVLVVDTAHGHSESVLEMVREHQATLSRDGDRGGQHRHRRGGRGPDQGRRGRRQGRDRARLDLHHARGGGRGRSADHGHLRLRARWPASTTCR